METERRVVIITSGTDCVHAGMEGYKLGTPLGGLAVASYLDAQGVPVQHIDLAMDRGIPLDAQAQDRVFGRLAEELAADAGKIAWIGLSMLASTDDALILGPVLRAALPDTPIVLGGYHPSSCWERVVEFEWLTAVVVGDGEHAAAKITENLAGGRPLGEDVPNLAVRGGSAPLNETVPLSDVPPLNLGLLAHPDRYPTINIVTTRGCPWRCFFCLEENMRGYRAHDLSHVAAQLESAASKSTTRLMYVGDPVFGVDKRRLAALCEVLQAAPYRYGASTRVDVIPPELVPNLKAAGFDALYVGLETASPEALVRMNKVRTLKLAHAYVDKAYAFFRALFEHDITPVIGFLFGYPGDIEAEYRQCIEFVERLREIYDESGGQGGFVTVGADSTEVYESSTLKRNGLPEDTRLGSERFVGLRVVEQASASVDRGLVDRYQQERQRWHVISERARPRLGFFGGYPVSQLVRQHAASVQDGVLYAHELDLQGP
jgi:anaerobic magnesium-protoporphyrin IX monomethyl ester cyclase